MRDFSPCFYDFLSKPKKDQRDSICVFSPSAWHLRSSRIFKMNLAITSYFSPDLYIKLVYLLISVLIQQILLLSESFTLPPFFAYPVPSSYLTKASIIYILYNCSCLLTGCWLPFLPPFILFSISERCFFVWLFVCLFV